MGAGPLTLVVADEPPALDEEAEFLLPPCPDAIVLLAPPFVLPPADLDVAPPVPLLGLLLEPCPDPPLELPPDAAVPPLPESLALLRPPPALLLEPDFEPPALLDPPLFCCVALDLELEPPFPLVVSLVSDAPPLAVDDSSVSVEEELAPPDALSLPEQPERLVANTPIKRNA